jgi:MYXO-CTERM domain-containing protein
LLACTAPQICVGGVCQTDRCLNKTCPTGSYCSDGNCIDLCVPGKCGDGQRCVAGECIPDTCATVPCPIPGQFCNPATGQCEVDRCPSVTCGAGMTCVPSTRACIPDPCRTIECPGDCWYCGVTNDGHGTCILDTNKCKQVDTKVGQRGGGEAGCGCAVGAEGGQGDRLGLGLLLLAFGLVVVGRRRR